MTQPYDDALLDEAASRLVDDREYMIIDAPDPVEPTDDADEEED